MGVDLQGDLFCFVNSRGWINNALLKSLIHVMVMDIEIVCGMKSMGGKWEKVGGMCVVVEGLDQF